MKSEDPFREVELLLRSRQPDPQPSPGLEARIRRALDRQPRPRKALIWPWFVLPPAVAMAAVMLWPQATAPTAAPPMVELAAPPADNPPPAEISVPVPDSGLLALNAVNPLETEVRALRRDARRAGRFLIDCLPSVSLPER